MSARWRRRLWDIVVRRGLKSLAEGRVVTWHAETDARIRRRAGLASLAGTMLPRRGASRTIDVLRVEIAEEMAARAIAETAEQRPAKRGDSGDLVAGDDDLLDGADAGDEDAKR